MTSCVEVWQNSQRFANRCDYSDIQERRSQAMHKLQRISLLSLPGKVWKSICQMLERKCQEIVKSKLEDGQFSFRPSCSTTDQFFTLKQIFEKLWEYAKISLHALSILKKHMTEFLGINFGRFCSSIALVINCCAPLSHSTADRRFVFRQMASNQSRSMWALDSGKGAFCHLSFSMFT